ncbi:MAG: hypothetical protein DLM72_19455, partial [Candidatus Nitrosopolaris wilkensis]
NRKSRRITDSTFWSLGYIKWWGSTGSASILNGFQTQATIISYAWTQVSGTTVSLNGANTATPTFTAPQQATVLSFSLTVTDSTGAVSSPATVSVTVT